MRKRLKEKTREALTSVVPITLIVFLLSISIAPMPINYIVMFLGGAFFLIIGMGLFSLGADMAMMPMGEGLGIQLTKIKKIGIIALLSFILGVVITVAEPDLQVLAKQVPAIPDSVLIATVAVGVGIFLAVAILRILFKVKLSTILLILYAIVFGVSIFVPNSFLAVAFDSGGVTTGPITVPFILAMGLGLASIRGDKDGADDSFGLVAICSIGPILAVLLLGIVYDPQSVSHTQTAIPDVVNMQDVAKVFLESFPQYFYEVLLAIVPVAVVFIIFQLISKRYRKQQILRMIVGFLYTYLGLVLFLTGVNVGFVPVGDYLGSYVAASTLKWLLVPIGMIIGYFIVSAEPAVHVLNKQVEDVSGGTIPASAMKFSLSIGVAVAVGLSMVRVLTGISIYWLIVPGYVIALGLSFFVPRIFTGIAFDSGGVASGPMTSTFLLPLAIGACEGAGGNILTDAFGVVAMVAMAPLITVQIMGLVYAGKMKKLEQAEDVELVLAEGSEDVMDDDGIIDFGEDDS